MVSAPGDFNTVSFSTYRITAGATSEVEFESHVAVKSATWTYLIPEYSDSPEHIVWEETDESLSQLPTSWVVSSQAGMNLPYGQQGVRFASF